MSGLILTVTNAGRAALVNLPNTGTNAVLMASVGVSATSFAPTPATTALPGEIKRISTIAGEAVANDTIHVTVRDESSAVYTVRSFGLYLSDGTLFAVYSQSDPIMEKSAQAMLLLAIDVAFADINATQITFGDTNFINPPATTERQGVVELATEAETTTGTDAAHAVTPKALRAAVTSWLDTRFGNGAPSTFVKGLLTSASAAALRLSLGLKSAALKDEGPGNGLDADLLDGLQASAFAQLSGAAFSGTVSTTRDFNLVYNGVPSLVGLSMSGAAMAAYNSITGTASVEIFKWLGSGGATKMALTEGGALSVLGSLVWTAGNDGAGSGMDADLLDGLQASDFQRVTSQNMAAVNGYRVYADGTKECWTRLTIGEHAYTTWTLPVAHTDFVHPSLAMTTAGGVSDVQDNTGITAINGTPPVSITFWNADNRTITIWVRTIGR